jgi:hypothetical protein
MTVRSMRHGTSSVLSQHAPNNALPITLRATAPTGKFPLLLHYCVEMLRK